MYRIGIDVGGTFTDLVLLSVSDGLTSFHKVPSTPSDPSEAIARGIAELMQMNSVEPSDVSHVGHGTTVATNLIIERKGARTGLITTKGFRDVMEIGRQTRPDLYDYRVTKPPPLVPRRSRFEVTERITASGVVMQPLAEDEVRHAIEKMRRQAVEAVAICLLHAYRNPVHEQQVSKLIRELMPGVYISVSSEVLPEFREFERLSTTALNAVIGPRMERYLDRFVARVKALGIIAEPFTIHSNGGLMSVRAVRSFPVRTCLSGPAAGVVGAATVGKAVGVGNIITFDVGGTSTDVSLIGESKPLFTSSRHVAGYPVKTPMVDIHVVGAGGGSIAWMDDAGALKVGPRSAGADPGPVAYGRGGDAPTITDAMICLHRLNPVSLLNGRLPVDEQAAVAAIMERVARPLGLTLEAAAEGIIRIANANMCRAIRSVSTERGYDLGDFTLFAYGGAGPLHATEVGIDCGVRDVIVPVEPGTMCARGILLTDVSFDFVRTEIAELTPASWRRVCELFDGMAMEASAWLERENVAPERRSYRFHVDARYRGQNFEVVVPVDAIRQEGRDDFIEAFQQMHRREYGYVLEGRVIEIINFRLQAIGEVPHAPQRYVPRGAPDKALVGYRSIYMGSSHPWVDTPVYARECLAVGATLTGPAVVEEMSSTTLLFPRQRANVDSVGNLVIHIKE